MKLELGDVGRYLPAKTNKWWKNEHEWSMTGGADNGENCGAGVPKQEQLVCVSMQTNDY